MSWNGQDYINYAGAYYDHSGSTSSWTDSSSDDDDGMVREILVEKLEEYDPRIFNIDFNDLEDLQKIGGGNFGAVWKSMYFGTEVAVKQLLDIDDEDMHKYITREMLTLRDVRHPNVVQLMGLCKHASGIYIVTEFIGGGNLRKLLKNRNIDLPWLLRTKIAIDVAMALTYLHSRGIIHRDLKSQNLLVDEGYRIKVCDFGFSRVVDKSEFMTVCGTDEWMAPEVRLGKMYDERADIFSYAMVLTEIITRNKPVERLPGRGFQFDTELFRRSSPADTPKPLSQLAIQMAHGDPAQRPSFKQCLKVLKSLRKQLEGEQDGVISANSSHRLSQKFELTYMQVSVTDDTSSVSALEKRDQVSSPGDAAASSSAAASAPAVVSTPSTPVSTSPPSVPADHSGSSTVDDDGSKRQLRAVADFKARHDSELSIKQGDVLVFKGLDALQGLIEAELNGEIGWLPKNVVQELQDDANEPTHRPTIVATTSTSSPDNSQRMESFFSAKSKNTKSDSKSTPKSSKSTKSKNTKSDSKSTPKGDSSASSSKNDGSKSTRAEPVKKRGKFRSLFSRKKKIREVGLNLAEDALDTIIIKMAENIKLLTHEGFERTFLGSEACAWLVANRYGKNTKAVQKLMRYLLQRRVLFSPADPASTEFNDKYPYRFQLVEWQETKLLNADKTWQGTSRRPNEVVHSLIKLLTTCVAKYVSKDDKNVNFTRLASSADFRKICLLASELQKVNIEKMSNNEERVTFWVNVRNFLVLLAHVRWGRPTTPDHRQALFSDLRAFIGYHQWTIGEIEKIMILGIGSLPSVDPRAKIPTTGKNPIMLLPLYDGTKTCVAIAKYSPESFGDILEEVVRDWLSQSIKIDRDKVQLVLPYQLRKLSSQFNHSGTDILTLLTGYLSSEVKRFLSSVQQKNQRLSLKYESYNWQPNYPCH
eukprot:CAMPEP_0201553242 /NCGR_PEP_ID=MMETSP0173_2-20130828/19526_1 /ASSEMBLY_ACC=CAM_ASM_000268 /TAXON_ID=218659 /ORGANISM="Vexillifera sp., Strain DIVA3 564/2" /LENGTH=927 /DNA_ID=CAMNT_0047963879 /DNA_START=36 /DNA_END=2819 /DNA_ORIENTATION=-